jgi:hypothetical protein
LLDGKRQSAEDEVKPVIRKPSVSASELLKRHEEKLQSHDTVPVLGRGLKAGNDSFVDLDEVPSSRSPTVNVAKVIFQEFVLRIVK